MAGEATAEDIDRWHTHGHQPSLAIIPKPICAFLPSGLRPVRVVPSGTVREPVTSPTLGVGHKGAHVIEDWDSRPMLCEDSLAELVLLAEPHSSHTRSLKAEIESPDSAEE